MATCNRVVLLSAPDGYEAREAVLKFRLIYDGPLQPSQRDPENGAEDPISLHKHKIRKAFHGQLKRLWEVTPHLGQVRGQYFDFDLPKGVVEEDRMLSLQEGLAENYKENGFRFVPLVRDKLKLLCSLDILFLRRDIPGSIIQAGDVDNRIKTLIDALRKPRGKYELGGCVPEQDEDPFFCLLEDDRNVTAFAVETDTLLDPETLTDADNRRSRVVVTVELKPYQITGFNSRFA